MSLGCHVEDASLPHADPTSQVGAMGGFVKRVAAAPPKIKPETLAKFRAFVKKYVRKHFQPLYESEITFEDWLANVNYPLWRKNQLRKCWEEFEAKGLPSGGSGRVRPLYRCKSFMKDEFYAEYKWPRTINSRSDEFKCLVGPIFKAIEGKVFARPDFIKRVPVDERPSYIYDRLWRAGARYIATDYKTFEASFTSELMEACEMELYSYMTSNIPGNRLWLHHVKEAMLGENECVFKDFVGHVPATRMSGEMCTSLGNGFTNLMVTLFVMENFGTEEAKGVFEGDDGLIRVDGEVPTKEAYAELGLKVELEVHTQLSEASFCGLIFHEAVHDNVADPVETLTRFAWAPAQYRASSRRVLDKLLRAKALSLAYSYPGCPILQEFANAMLRLTSHIKDSHALWQSMKGASQYEVEQIFVLMRKNSAPVSRPVSMLTRELVESKYSITIARQLELEAHFRSMTAVSPIKLAETPSLWKDYYSVYAEDVPLPCGPKVFELPRLIELEDIMSACR